MLFAKKQMILLLIVHTLDAFGKTVTHTYYENHMQDINDPDEVRRICERDDDCLNGGMCRRNEENEHICDCTENFGGFRCEVHLPCISLEQSCRIINAVCVIIDNHPICECPNGTLYHRKSGLCEEECDCGPEGNCSFENGLKKCKCEHGFADNDGNCTECNCGPNGICGFKEGQKTCYCEDKFADKDGECTECDCGLKFLKGGCTFEKGEKKCYCIEGFEDYDGICAECDCGPNATCKFEKGRKKCYCKIGFKDKNGKCTECDCGPKGFCSFENGLKKCYCSQGFEDKNGICTAVDYCRSMPCQNGGICHQNGTFYSCFCMTPYFGALCEKDPCTENQCRNGGTCVRTRYSFKCHCMHPYYGDICQFVDECSDNPCFNGGTCFMENNSFKCKCRYGYYGKHCEKEGFVSTTEETSELENTSMPTVDPLQICKADSDCQNGGVCRNSSCECLPNFAGYWCEKNFLCERLQPTCLAMGATCKIVGLSAICDCPPNKAYQPKSGTCEDTCSPSNCFNGRCENDGQTYKCICENGFTGSDCGVKDNAEKSYVWFALMTSLLVLTSLLLIIQLYMFYRNTKRNIYNSNEFPIINMTHSSNEVPVVSNTHSRNEIPMRNLTQSRNEIPMRNITHRRNEAPIRNMAHNGNEIPMRTITQFNNNEIPVENTIPVIGTSDT